MLLITEIIYTLMKSSLKNAQSSKDIPIDTSILAHTHTRAHLHLFFVAKRPNPQKTLSLKLSFLNDKRTAKVESFKHHKNSRHNSRRKHCKLCDRKKYVANIISVPQLVWVLYEAETSHMFVFFHLIQKYARWWK